MLQRTMKVRPRVSNQVCEKIGRNWSTNRVVWQELYTEHLKYAKLQWSTNSALTQKIYTEQTKWLILQWLTNLSSVARGILCKCLE